MRYGIVGGVLLLLGMQLIGVPSPALAQDKAAKPAKGEAVPVTIQSDHLDVWEKKQQALFTGNVHLLRGDFELYSDSLLVYYLSGKQGSGIDHALATGHVRMIQEGKTGTADSAVINNRKHLVTLRGHAVMEQPGGQVAGDTIVHDMNAKTTEVMHGEENRVTMHIDGNQMNGNGGLDLGSGAAPSAPVGDKAAEFEKQGKETAMPSGTGAAQPAASTPQDGAAGAQP